MHANIRNNEIIDFNSMYLDEDITRVEITQEMYELYQNDTRSVIYQDGEIVENPNYEEEIQKQLQERRNQEIDEKVKELSEMATVEMIKNNKENVDTYCSIINSLIECKS